MPRKADFQARASLYGVDDLNLPWKRALRRAERRAGRSFSRIERMGMRAGRGIRRGFQGAGKAIRGTGRAVGMAQRGFSRFAKAGGMVAAGLGVAMDRAGKFELEVARLGNLLEADVDPVAEYADTIKRIALETGTAPIMAAEAAYMAFSGGVEKSKTALQEFLPEALRAAKAGKAGPAEAVLAMTKALNVFGKEGMTAKDIANKLFVTEALGVTDFGALSDEMGQVLSVGHAFGATFDEMMGAMAPISKVEKSTAVAFTQISSIISGIVKPSKKAGEAIKHYLGEEYAGAEAIRTAGGLTKWLTRLKEAVDQHGEGVITEVFGRKEAIKGAAHLVKAGFGDMIGITDRLGNSAVEAERNWANVQRRMGFRMQQLKVGADVVFGELGAGIAEGLGVASMSADDMADNIMKAGSTVRAAAKGFAGGFVQALVPGQKLADINWTKMATTAGKAFGSVTRAVGKVAVGFARLVEGVGEAKDAWDDYYDALWRGESVEDPDVKAAKKHGARVIGTGGREAMLEGTPFWARGRGMDPWEAEQWGKIGEYVAGAEYAPTAEQRAAFGWKAVARGGKSKGLAAPWATKTGGPRSGGMVATPMPTGHGAWATKTNVGGEVRVVIHDKSNAKRISVEATSQNPHVPVRASVGKRSVGAD